MARAGRNARDRANARKRKTERVTRVLKQIFPKTNKKIMLKRKYNAKYNMQRALTDKAITDPVLDYRIYFKSKKCKKGSRRVGLPTCVKYIGDTNYEQHLERIAANRRAGAAAAAVTRAATKAALAPLRAQDKRRTLRNASTR